ncbi:hypothetical protein BKA62DRAFT_786607 [Auriculariales sp. MPI-PUGE-AT-0066]|nr:hypothetical protein BKA62DRAFT_786607 [Auriculariales sp. MPI-PUGE-AT-0066]
MSASVSLAHAQTICDVNAATNLGEPRSPCALVSPARLHYTVADGKSASILAGMIWIRGEALDSTPRWNLRERRIAVARPNMWLRTSYSSYDSLTSASLTKHSAYFNLLRILHYSETHFPLKSVFVSSKSRPSAATSPTSQSTPGSEPPSALMSSPEPTTAATALTSASESSPFPSVKLRKGAQRPSIVDRPSAESTSPDVTHRTLRYDNAHPSLAISVRYPNWREHILRCATHAGRARQRERHTLAYHLSYKHSKSVKFYPRIEFCVDKIAQKPLDVRDRYTSAKSGDLCLYTQPQHFS